MNQDYIRSGVDSTAFNQRILNSPASSLLHDFYKEAYKMFDSHAKEILNEDLSSNIRNIRNISRGGGGGGVSVYECLWVRTAAPAAAIRSHSDNYVSITSHHNFEVIRTSLVHILWSWNANKLKYLVRRISQLYIRHVIIEPFLYSYIVLISILIHYMYFQNAYKRSYL